MFGRRRERQRGEVRVSIRHDRLEAYLSFPGFARDGSALDASDLARVLRAHGVEYGIDRAALREVVRMGREGTLPAEVLVARGDPGEPGKPARLELVPCFTEEGIPRIVEPGEVVLRILAAEAPKPGRGVDGSPVHPSQAVESHPLVPGDGLSPAPDGRSYVARHEGYVRTRDGRVEISHVFCVAGDLPATRETVRIRGRVEVEGGLRPGARIEASGSIRIDRDVGEGATIRADGEICIWGNVGAGAVIEAQEVTIAGTVSNGAGGMVRARKALRVGRATDAVLECEGDIDVDETVERSVLRAGGHFRCIGTGCEVLRSRIEALAGIEVENVGRQRGGGRSVLVAGITEGINAEIRAKQDDIRRLERYREHLYAAFSDRYQGLVRDRDAVLRLRAEEREAYAKAREGVQREQETTDARISALRGEVRRLEALRRVRPGTVIRIAGAAYPPIDLIIVSNRLAVREKAIEGVVIAEGRNLRPSIVPIAGPDPQDPQESGSAPGPLARVRRTGPLASRSTPSLQSPAPVRSARARGGADGVDGAQAEAGGDPGGSPRPHRGQPGRRDPDGLHQRVLRHPARRPHPMPRRREEPRR